MNIRTLFACVGGCFGAGILAAAEGDSLPVQARTALERATDAMRSISTEGGYLWRYSPDLAARGGEIPATPARIWVQPPGTPSMGMAFLRAYDATHNVRYLDAARGAAFALVRGQLESGGWDHLVEFEAAEHAKWLFHEDASKVPPDEKAKRVNVTSLDDDNTQSALRFLLACVDAAKAAPDPRDERIREARDYGLRKIIEAQYPIGAWPRRWDGTPLDPATSPVKTASIPTDYPREQPDSHCYGHYAFNDGAHRDLVMTLLDAHRRRGRDEYLAAAKRGADFILLAQLPEPQPAWAQQYNANVEPAWARAFEPPSVTTSESVGVMGLLVDLHLEFGDEKYMKPIPSAIAWSRRSALEPNRRARLHELGTNRPLYGDHDKKIHHTLEEVSEERRTGHGWRGEYGVGAALKYFEDVSAAGRDRWRTERAEKTLSPKEKKARAEKIESTVKRIVSSLDAQGRWISLRQASRVAPGVGEWIETETFIRNVGVLCEHLSLAN